MGGRLCIENKTDIPVAVFLEQTSIRYWAKIPPGKRVIWHQEHFHIDRGLYTLRAVDASSATFQGPNMITEKAKAVGSGVLMGIGGAAVVAGAALIIIPGIGVVLTGVGGAIALLGAAGGVGGIAAAKTGGDSMLRQAKKSCVPIGGDGVKYVITLSNLLKELNEVPENETDGASSQQVDNKQRQIVLTKHEYNYEDETDPDTVFVSDDNTSRDNTEASGTAAAKDNSETDFVHVSRPDTTTCPYRELCERFMDSLNIPGAYLEPEYNKCFCGVCSTERDDKPIIYAGKPKKKSAVPLTYCKFGVKLMSPEVVAGKIFDNYHICYHGTHPDNIKNILRHGRLLKPGDVDAEGKSLKIRQGHWNEKTAPKDHDVKQYFFTPSLKYTESGSLYAVPFPFIDPVTKKKYRTRTVLQVRIKPGSYKEGRQTVGAKSDIDPNFQNKSLEWMTNRENVHFIYGILVKMEESADYSADFSGMGYAEQLAGDLEV